MANLYLQDEDRHWTVETMGGGGAFFTVVKDKHRSEATVERIGSNTEHQARTLHVYAARKYHVVTSLEQVPEPGSRGAL